MMKLYITKGTNMIELNCLLLRIAMGNLSVSARWQTLENLGFRVNDACYPHTIKM